MQRLDRLDQAPVTPGRATDTRVAGAAVAMALVWAWLCVPGSAVHHGALAVVQIAGALTGHR